ncbi:MAG: SUF system NifU family Fe-S cluster assembly protein [Candidatus Beckwithbacteria bacterium]|nr:SUF system NifU family Fe-S cluster assembly protein [Candidatus Beckwithbacteria bacterium]
MDIYREEILDHYKNPRNFGPVDEFKIKAMDRNASCGDVIEIGLMIKDKRITNIQFKGEGCAIAMAATSMLTEMVKGKTVVQVKKLTDQDMIKKLGINVSLGRKKCATLGLVVLQKLLI